MSESRRLPDSPSLGVVFRLRISPRIRSQNRNSLICSVRDLCRTDLWKNLQRPVNCTQQEKTRCLYVSMIAQHGLSSFQNLYTYCLIFNLFPSCTHSLFSCSSKPQVIRKTNSIKMRYQSLRQSACTLNTGFFLSCPTVCRF
jgi:hypothetical protein